MNCKNPYCDNDTTKSGGGYGWCSRCSKRKQIFGCFEGTYVPESAGRGAVTKAKLFEGVDRGYVLLHFLFKFACAPTTFLEACEKHDFNYNASVKAGRRVPWSTE